MNRKQRQEVEHDLDLSLPDQFERYDAATQQLLVDYLRQLDAVERKAYTIGKEHLGTSFNVLKSNGFASWRKKTP